ncbi:MAG: dTMP kinase [Bdellovibrionales bacterium]|nr:dTMP kinase [Bdellovibrionales bacterium]
MYFIAFEGLDGSGKSTLIQRLNTFLKKTGKSVVITREPGGTPLGEKLRALILSRESSIVPNPRAELLMYEAARAQLVESVIRPSLQQGMWVLCDRFSSSSLAFQGGGRGVDEISICSLNDFATLGLQPDLYVLIDVPVLESEKRRQNRAHVDRFEAEKSEFHERVRLSYLKQVEQNPKRWFVIDGGQTPEKIEMQLCEHLRARSWV